jgi:hypothetical protein
MSGVRVRGGAPPVPAQSPETRGVSEKQLSAIGLDSKQLFGWNRVAYRRIEKVTPTHVEIEGKKVPRAMLGGAPVVEGQWLRFTQDKSGTIGVSVDLKATLKGESRLSDLFQTLNRR